MASLALVVSLIVLFVLCIGPITYVCARLNLPKIIIYIMSLVCFVVGINFCLISFPAWYLGLIPIYFGYISITRVSGKTN